MAQQITEESGVHKAWYEEARNVTRETLPEFVRRLTEDYEHDYGTICHAIAAAAIGAAWAVEKSPQGGITGFQGGAVMWEFIKHWNSIEPPARLLEYRDMLFPQMARKFTAISADTWQFLQDEARKNLAEKSGAAARVVEHWQRIADGRVPFGFTVDAA